MYDDPLLDRSDGASLFGLVFVVLLALKLTGLATISWWWVFLPLFLPPLMMLAVICVALVVAAIGSLMLTAATTCVWIYEKSKS